MEAVKINLSFQTTLFLVLFFMTPLSGSRKWSDEENYFFLIGKNGIPVYRTSGNWNAGIPLPVKPNTGIPFFRQRNIGILFFRTIGIPVS